MNLFDVFYKTDLASVHDIFIHLSVCEKLFKPPLSEYVDIKDYSIKIREKAVTLEAWNNETLIGLIAVYLNDPNKGEGYITNVSVTKNFQNGDISSELLTKTIDVAKIRGFKGLRLSVFKGNLPALRLYEKLGFEIIEEVEAKFIMQNKMLERV